MGFRALTLLLCGLLLQGCAGPRSAPADALPWRDQRFAHDPALVTVTRQSLFALDAELADAMRSSPVAERGGQGARTAELLARVFGPELKAFAYAGGHSTVAAETWRNRRGDCLSLSVMSVALARALDVPAQIQEVRVPPLFDRRGGLDFVNQHVNVLVPNERDLRAVGRTLPAGYVIIDFEPQPGARAKGRALSDDQVLARFLNNRGAEYLTAGDERRAYAHFRAAIGADAGFAPAYGNLAQLYLRAGLTADAEALWRHTLSLDDGAEVALAALHRLLLAQGRETEAQAFDTQLRSRRAQDPYYWLGLGLQHLQQEQFAQAAAALERAQALTSGFDEVHRYLAIAYWRDGRLHLARDQLVRLASLGGQDAKLALLQQKVGLPATVAAPARP